MIDKELQLISLSVLSEKKKRIIVCPTCSGHGRIDNGMYYDDCNTCCGDKVIFQTTETTYEALR